jgi:hypothetical protein
MRRTGHRGAVGEHQEALARRLGHRHGADVHVGYIAHVGDAEALAADNGHRSVEHHLGEVQRGPHLSGQGRPEDERRVDHHELRVTTVVLDEDLLNVCATENNRG